MSSRRINLMVMMGLLALLAVLLGLTLHAVEPPMAKPQWQRMLQGEDAKKSSEMFARSVKLQSEDNFEDALIIAKQVADLHKTKQGADHWLAVIMRWEVDAIRRVVRAEANDRREYAKINHRDHEAATLEAQARYREAMPIRKKIHAIALKLLGKEHPHTTSYYNMVLANLEAQGENAEAAKGHLENLCIRRAILGEKHPHTAISYNNLAVNQSALGRYEEAEKNQQAALKVQREVLGEEHPETIASWDNLAANMDHQGRHVEAEAGHRKALALRCRVLGEDHINTGKSFNNLAVSLNALGRYPEAEAANCKALSIFSGRLGKDHPFTGISCYNLASTLSKQEKYREAEAVYCEALAILIGKFGAENSQTAYIYNGMAFNQLLQSRYLEAAESFKKALDIRCKTLGEEHPATALTRLNMAFNLNVQGKYPEAECGLRQALAIRLKTLGEDHPSTADAFSLLASNLNAQGKYPEAEAEYQHGADTLARVRLRLGETGLDHSTSIFNKGSPLRHFAALLARNGKPDLAWQRLEESLGRGSWDELSTRLRRPESERDKQSQLISRLQRIDRRLELTITPGKPTPDQLRKRNELSAQRLQAQADLLAFSSQLEKTYGPGGGEVFDRATIQAALSDDTALIAWIDRSCNPKEHDPNGDHWVALLTSKGLPIWERMSGTGPNGLWCDEDTLLGKKLFNALNNPRGDWQSLANRLYKQRLAPVSKHLNGIRKLIVLPSPNMDGFPFEVVATDMTISYHHSGTMYAYLRKHPRPTTTGLLALGDPVFDVPAPGKEAPLPPGGVLLTFVIPGSTASLCRPFGLLPNDVLLRYGNIELANPADYSAAIATATTDKPVPIVFWREGKQKDGEVTPGNLGVVVAPAPAPKALADQRRFTRFPSARGGEWKQLPFTRIEIETLRRLFLKVTDSSGAPVVQTYLTGSDASEQRLDAMVQSHELGKYRYLHFGTHGEVNFQLPLRSAIILSRDNLPDPEKQFNAGLPMYNGQLTAERILRHWHLDAELVTLSACQTALGKHQDGAGYVGFAQALMLCGTRSVCLSLWKVDDAATALLMERFYQNLLGKRESLKRPMPKASALEEAKTWLRTLPREEALQLAAVLTNGVVPGKHRQVQPLLPAVPEAAKDAPPFGHPYFWAGFVLFGDPGSDSPIVEDPTATTTSNSSEQNQANYNHWIGLGLGVFSAIMAVVFLPRIFRRLRKS